MISDKNDWIFGHFLKYAGFLVKVSLISQLKISIKYNYPGGNIGQFWHHSALLGARNPVPKK